MSYTPLTAEELRAIARAEREEEHRRQLERAPKPQPRPIPAQGSQEWESRFPTQQITMLTPPHERQGAGPPEFIQLSPEQLRGENRIAALEGRVSQIEARLQRFFNEPIPKPDRI